MIEGIIQQGRHGSASPLGEAAIREEPLTERVHGPDIHGGYIVRGPCEMRDHTEERSEALLELERGFLREGAEKDLLWPHIVKHKQIEGPPQQDLGFAGARPRR